ncbi:MAG TPA: histidine kinase, partial [Gemmatimonadales bacterium]|nr:histidine kinase [Gemmatimonadales bacterium]
MASRKRAVRDPSLSELRRRLRAAEDTLRALQDGDVDALVVTRAGDQHVVTLQGTDLPYRVLLEQMDAGAVTLTLDGMIVYCNGRFAELARTPVGRIVGKELTTFVAPRGRAALRTLLEGARADKTRGEFELRGSKGAPVTVALKFAPLRLAGSDQASGVIGIVTDATEQRRQEEIRTHLIQQVMTAQDQERSRIARELHDETGQSLTAVLVGLRAIEQARSVAEAVELAERLREMAAQTLDEVGRLARGLHPRILDHLGLAVAATRLVQGFSRQHGIVQDTRIEGLDSQQPWPLLDNTIYRVLQEALTNVAKHAKAGRV